MSPEDPRSVLQRLVDERRDDYAGLSRLLGRNPAYVQQFIKRGVPKKLAENDRAKLARYFDIDEQLLGGPARETSIDATDLVPIPRYRISAAAGHGSIPDREDKVAEVAFSARWLEKLSSARPRDLSIIQVEGDSMSPTLSHGDDIMVDLSGARRKLSDGIYVLRRDDALLVKRVALHPTRSTLTIASDNPAFASWTDCAPDEIDIIGRVVWAGRRVE
jgi:phage repressor protein C with HTH and peptisase S24 domain